jgi:hypothetical protein
MNMSTFRFAFALAMALSAFTGVSRADTVEANCEVRKDGDTQKGRSGPCTFSQRQGFISLNLKNGESIFLSPAGGANQYRDDNNGHKVTRTSTGQDMSFKWEGGKRINVTLYNNGSRGNASYGAAATGNGSEYDRGYSDGMRNTWDREKHNQDYKNGYAAGEAARAGGGKHGNHSSGGQGYGVNRLGNGQFEIVWSKPFCSVLFDSRGLVKTTEDCTNQQIEQSKDAARRER